MSHKDILAEKINNFVSNKWTLLEFEKQYYNYYLEEVPENALTLPQSTFYGLVQEKLDWTSESPSELEKKEGWFDQSEYVEWLKKSFQEFQSNEDSWYENYVKGFRR